MAISIKEALSLPVMQNTKLLAGHQGLGNMIKWVTIVEIIEDITRFQDGEFLITTGFGLLDSEEKLKHFQSLLLSNKLSGVAIYTGFYMKEIPDSFLMAANKSGLPLMSIPTDINFSEITKAILEQIVNNQMQLLEYSHQIHKELTKLVFNNESLVEITKTLSKLTNGTTLLYENPYHVSYYQIAQSNICIKDQTVQLNQIDVNLEKELIICQTQGIAVTKIYHDYEIKIYPILVKASNDGCIVIIKPKYTWKELDDIAIEHAASVFAIEFLKRKAVEEEQFRLQGDFLEDIIYKNYANEAYIIEQGKKLGYDLSAKQTFFYFVIDHDLSSKDNHYYSDKLSQMVTSLLKRRKQSFILRPKLHSLLLLTNVVGYYSDEINSYCSRLAKDILDEWNMYYPNVHLQIGIGEYCEEVNALPSCMKEAQYAVQLAELVNKEKQIYHYHELGMYSFLLELYESNVDLKAFYKKYLDRLLLNKKQQGANLIETLDIYLSNNQGIQTTADLLYIHRHTLKYRLKQIEQKTGLNLSSSDDRMKLQLAILAYKLLQYIEQDFGKGAPLTI